MEDNVLSRDRFSASHIEIVEHVYEALLIIEKLCIVVCRDAVS